MGFKLIEYFGFLFIKFGKFCLYYFIFIVIEEEDFGIIFILTGMVTEVSRGEGICLRCVVGERWGRSFSLGLFSFRVCFFSFFFN